MVKILKKKSNDLNKCSLAEILWLAKASDFFFDSIWIVIGDADFTITNNEEYITNCALKFFFVIFLNYRNVSLADMLQY